VLDNLSKQIHGENPDKSSLYQNVRKKVDFIYGDVRDEHIWVKALDCVDVVAHLAAETGTGQSMYEIHNYTDVNVNGVAGLLHYITNKKHGVKKIIAASSRAIYGEGKYFCKFHGAVYPLSRNQKDMDAGDFEVKCPICKKTVFALPTDEPSVAHPTSVYGISKRVQEELILNCCKNLEIPAVVFRYQNVYGPGQSLKNPYTGILSIFSTRLIRDASINIFEDGLESRDFVYIDYVVNATIAGIEYDMSECISINVGTGNFTNVLRVAKTLKDLYKSASKINISGNYRLGDIRHNAADITLLKEKLNYHPKVPFEDGIGQFSEWVKSQEVDIEIHGYENSLEEMKARGLYK
jgi:dTDP-L-rhamnose 4-epimerase